jgi:hypothetical protein
MTRTFDATPDAVVRPRIRMLRWGAALVVLVAVTLLVTVWVAPGVPVGAVWAMAGAVALSVLWAVAMMHRAARWRGLAASPGSREAARVEVIRTEITRTGFRVDHRPIRGARFSHSFTIDRWFDLEPPSPGEYLDVWSSGADGRGPLLMRQPDGTWWAASGSLH